MPESSFSLNEYATKIIKRLGIGAKRTEKAEAKLLFKNDFERERMRQEIRRKVAMARNIIAKRVGAVVSLDGRPVVIGSETATDVCHLDFETVYSGLDAEGNLFVSTTDSKIPEGTTLLFMAHKLHDWGIESVESPNLESDYFKSVSRRESELSESEQR